MKRRGFLKVRDKVILHLAKYPDMQDMYQVPEGVGQIGIAETIKAKQNTVSYALKALKKEGYVFEKAAHFKGIKSKRKAYFPTEKGLALAEIIENEMENKAIKIRDLDGSLKEVKLSTLKTNLDKPLSMLDIVLFTSADGIFDCNKALEVLSKGFEMERQDFVDFSEKAPVPKHFFGREEEQDRLKKWISSQFHKIIVIHGIPGIGKTTLASKLLSDYKGKKNIFWYQFHEWDTLRNLTNLLSQFLSRIGKNGLSSYLKRNKTLDMNEVSDFLEDDLDKTESLLFFDDFHRAGEIMIRFFSSFAERLERMNAVNIVIIGRYIFPFYDRKAVVIDNTVAEMQLKGLDENSSMEFLRAKGISGQDIKKIYEITKGHPLTMELIKSVEEVTDGKSVKKYIHEEIFSKLTEEEKQLLRALSVYRYPVRVDAFLIEDNITHECLDSLLGRSLIYETQRDKYDVHELIREFFYRRLTPKLKRKYHGEAARYYLSQVDQDGLRKPGIIRPQPSPSLQNRVEALYHFLRAGEHESAAQLAVEHGAELINQGFLEELMNLLEDSNLWLVEGVRDKYEAQLLLLRGEVLRTWGEWDLALESYKEALAVTEERGEHIREAEAYRKIGDLFIKKSRWDEALQHLSKALSLSREFNDFLGEADACRGFGRVFWRKGEYDKAVTNYNKAIGCIEKIKVTKDTEKAAHKKALHIPVMASTYIDLGLLYDDKGDYEQAINHYENSLKLLNQIKDMPEMARVYNNLGVAWYRSGDLDKAIEFYEKCIEAAEKSHEITLKGWVLFNAGEAYAKKYDFERATNYCDKSLDILKKLDYKLGISGVYSTYGIIYKMRKEWDKAMEYFQKSIEIREEMNMPYRLADGYYEFGLMFKEKGDKKKARNYLKKALKIFEKLGNQRFIEKIDHELKGI